jgi:tetratricopeptide (TPR) repeat protein
MNQSVIEKSVRWVIERRQTILTAGTILAVGLFILSTVIFQKHKAREQGWSMLSFAENQILQGQTAPAAATLNELVKRYHSDPLVEQADQLLGSLSMLSGNAQQAVKMYEEGMKYASNENNKSLLMMSLGTAYEEEGNFQKADETYNEFLKEFPEHYLTPRILMSSIRVETLNNAPGAAREHYEKLLTLYPDTPWTKRAATYLEKNNASGKTKNP